MKTIAVVAAEKRLADDISKNINMYFSPFAEIKSFSLQELEKVDKIHADVVLLSAYTIFLKVKSKISDECQLQNYSQTLSKENAAKLMDAYDEEPFDRAYLVNIDYRFATNVIMELYEAGFTYIEFIPYFGDPAGLDDSIRVAVTPDERALVPEGADRVIDIGQRVMDAECVVELCEKLGLNTREVLSAPRAKNALRNISDQRRIIDRGFKREQDKGRRVYGGSHDARFNFRNIIGSSDIIEEKIKIAKRMASSDASVLITGESGTGKEVFAQSIHNSSNRKDYNFVAINCAAIPENLFESELFGYDEGAFSGAKKSGKAGYFELAHKGTLFLDEIGEMPILLQGKLLRAIEERRIARVGSSGLIDVDVRIIAATNQDLEELVLDKKFRSDLYFRLNVLPLSIPSLRERWSDIPELLYYLRDQSGGTWDVDDEVKDYLIGYSWPGNIRELRNIVQYLDSLGIPMIGMSDLPRMIGERQELRTAEQKIKAEEAAEKNKTDQGKPADRPSFGNREFMDLILLEGRNLELIGAVLGILDDAASEGRSLGRSQVTERMAQEGYPYSEAEVRTAMRKLSEQGFIRSDRGRGGSRILDKGRRLRSELNGIKGI